MDATIPIHRQRQRVPMMDASTLEGRTRPAASTPAAVGRRLRLGLAARETPLMRRRDRGPVAGTPGRRLPIS
jgi:hypothetical protein